MRGAYSARPNRLAPCYLLADKHGQTATRHLGLLTTTALPAEDTDHLILVGWQKTKPGSGPRDGSFVEGGGAGGEGKHGAARVRDELPLGETRSKAGPLTGEQKNETKMSSPGEAIRPPLMRPLQLKNCRSRARRAHFELARRAHFDLGKCPGWTGF